MKTFVTYLYDTESAECCPLAVSEDFDQFKEEAMNSLKKFLTETGVNDFIEFTCQTVDLTAAEFVTLKSKLDQYLPKTDDIVHKIYFQSDPANDLCSTDCYDIVEEAINLYNEKYDKDYDFEDVLNFDKSEIEKFDRVLCAYIDLMSFDDLCSR